MVWLGCGDKGGPSVTALCRHVAVPCAYAVPSSRTMQPCSCVTELCSTTPLCHAMQPCSVTMPRRAAVPYSCAMQLCRGGRGRVERNGGCTDLPGAAVLVADATG